MNKDMRQLVRRLRELGCVVDETHRHFKVTLADRQPVFLSRTPSDHRALDNMRRDIRRCLGIAL